MEPLHCKIMAIKEKLKDTDFRSICDKAYTSPNAFSFSLCKSINSLGPRYYSRTIDYTIESSSGAPITQAKIVPHPTPLVYYRNHQSMKLPTKLLTLLYFNPLYISHQNKDQIPQELPPALLFQRIDPKKYCELPNIISEYTGKSVVFIQELKFAMPYIILREKASMRNLKRMNPLKKSWKL